VPEAELAATLQQYREFCLTHQQELMAEAVGERRCFKRQNRRFFQFQLWRRVVDPAVAEAGIEPVQPTQHNNNVLLLLLLLLTSFQGDPPWHATLHVFG
jgi:hypothetical protein